MTGKPIPFEILIERGRVIEPNGCHSYHGRRDKYPAAGFRKKPIARTLLGLTPGDGLEARHTCDVNWCINPEHLVKGTRQDNMDDMVSRGRALNGERNPHAKLTAEQVAAIRADPRPSRLIAPEYGVRSRTVRRIRQGVRWSQ